MGTLFYKSWLGWLSPDFLGVLTHNGNPGISRANMTLELAKLDQYIPTISYTYTVCMYIYMIIYAYAPYGSKCFLNQSVVAALPCKDGSFPANLSQT